MFRYLALLFDPKHETQPRASTQLADALTRQHSWSQAYIQPGLQVWCTQPNPQHLGVQTLPNQRGVILGAVFERPGGSPGVSASRHARFDVPATQQIVGSGGDALIRRYWGNYVAVLHDAREAVTRIIKDPTGTLPCYYTQHRDVVILFASVEDCRLLGLPRFTISDAYLRERVLSDGSDMTLNALNEVTPVLRGACHEFAHQGGVRRVHREFLWSPQSFTQATAISEASSLAARDLNTVVRSCTRTWASCCPRALLRLSGGLDSTIVAACLTEEPMRELTAYTYYDQRAISDERSWARTAAAHFGLSHREFAIDPRGTNLASLDRLGPTPEPIPTLGYVQRSLLERAITDQHPVDAVFTGIGGDSVFGGDACALAVSEHLRYHGLTPRALYLAGDVARTTQLTVASVTVRALRRWLWGSRMRDQRLAMTQRCTLAASQLRNPLNERSEYPHPWFAGLTDIPWSTVRRLGPLTYSPHFYPADASVTDVSPQIISPLCDQPVVELCLRIPLYVHFDGGRERGLARRAFAEVLPEAIRERQWKDRAPGYFEELIANNLGFLRERLLDGVLMRAHLLDRRAVEAALSDSPVRNDTRPGELLQHLDTELWARHWIA